MIVVFGSINVDLTFSLAALPGAGETNLAQEVMIGPGGKGANQAVAAARDGARVTIVGAVGRDAFAATALAGLREAAVDVSRVAETGETTGCAAILIDRTGRNAIAVGSGANRMAVERAVEDALLGPDTIVLLQMEVDAAQTAALIRRARAAGGRIVLNLAPYSPLPDDALQMVDLLVVNEAEAHAMGHGPDAASIRAALGVDVIRTLGGDGSELATADGLLRIPAHPVSVIDTSAAGDCYVGVLAAAWDRGASLPDAMRRASVAAGLACARPGSQASLPHAAEIDGLMLAGIGPEVG